MDYDTNSHGSDGLLIREGKGSYRDLQVWQKSMNLVKEIYAIAAKFPKEERYGLKSQIQRAAVSIPSNIAEGQSRGGVSADFARFLRMALGSLAEVDTQLELAIQLQYLESNEARSTADSIRDLRKMLHGLINSIVAR